MIKKALGWFFLLLFLNGSFGSYYETLGDETVSTGLLDMMADEDNASEENSNPIEEEKEYLAAAPSISVPLTNNTIKQQFHFSDKLIVVHPEIAELPPWQV